MEAKFGARVASIVRECSDDKDMGKVERKKAQVAHAAETSPGAQLVKYADKISNLTSLLKSVPPSWSSPITMIGLSLAPRCWRRCCGPPAGGRCALPVG